jgi:hypothetical protein
VTSTNSGITRYDGFNPNATGASDQSFLVNMPRLSEMDELQRSRYLNDLADEYIRDHPLECLKLAALKIARLWSPVPLSSQFSRPLYWVVGLVYTLPFLLTALIGIFIPCLSRRSKAFLLTPIVYFTVIHAASVSSLRYRLPLEPLMGVLAASALPPATKES